MLRITLNIILLYSRFIKGLCFIDIVQAFRCFDYRGHKIESVSTTKVYSVSKSQLKVVSGTLNSEKYQ